MYQLLQHQKEALQIQWGRIAPHEPMADVTPADALALGDLWIKIAPHELHTYAASQLEMKAVIELSHNIPDFWAPSHEDMVAFEEGYQAHCKSYTIWK